MTDAKSGDQGNKPAESSKPPTQKVRIVPLQPKRIVKRSENPRNIEKRGGGSGSSSR